MDVCDMICDKCGSHKHVRNIKGIGNRCYGCFDDQIMKMLEFQETWLEEDIIPDIKTEISDGIMKDGENYDIKGYIDNSSYNSETIENAIEEMLSGNALPEIVRIYLNKYTGNIMDYVDSDIGDDYDESE
jgi:hypothetical protein